MLNQRLKLVIFDLDGTLLDAYPAITKSFNYVMRRLKYPLQSPSIIRRAVGRGDEGLLKPFLKPQDLKKAVSLYRAHHAQALLRGSRLYPKAKQLLSYLKNKGYKLAVASNRPTKFSRILIRYLKLDKYFDYVLCADRIRNKKPHPQILNKITR
ncbi:MAG: HAD-IA family hydrolase, partial [Candidatus Omnitrophica bacterium]|nr:HAD-IA family hydrolase [Candidatus Omnitrophota bacterium]